jgi:PAS domain S-box-containing protein
MSQLCEALKLSEELRHISLFENMPSGCLVIDLSGEIIDVNPSALRILGSPSAEVTKEVNILSFPPLVDAGVSDIARRALGGEKITDDIIYTSRWGKTSTIRFTSVPIYDGDFVCLALVMMEDLTEYSSLKSELERNNKLLKTVIDAVPSLIWMKDKEGKYIHANKAFEEFNAFVPGGITGKIDAEVWPTELVGALQEADKQAMECEYPIHVTENIQHPTLGSKWYSTTKVGVCDSKDQVIGTVGISCDITRKHERDQILAEAIDTLTASLNRNIYVK